MNISFENVSKVSALLTLNIEKADYADRVKKALKDFSKKASIPGFRAGKVPASLIEKRFGTEIKAEEIKAIMDGEVKGRTVFYRNEDGEPCLKNNHVKGFFKSACAALRTDKTTLSSKITSYKKEIDLRVFVYADEKDPSSRFLPIRNHGEIGICQRPLRAQTMQGERVALADSEEIQAGAYIEFDVVVLKNDKKPLGVELIKEWLDYARYNGFGQWRNSGHGAAVYEILE